jgi:hypothetical protein
MLVLLMGVIYEVCRWDGKKWSGLKIRCEEKDWVCWIWGSHSGDYKGYDLLCCKAVYSVRSPETFPRNISPPSSCHKFIAGFLLGLLFNPEDRPSTSTTLHGVVTQEIVVFEDFIHRVRYRVHWRVLSASSGSITTWSFLPVNSQRLIPLNEVFLKGWFS